MSKNLIRQIGWYGVKFAVGSALALLLLVTAMAARPAYAADIVVNNAGDTAGACATTGTGICTLRDALTFANSNAGADTITFNILSGGTCSAANTCTITLGAELPGPTEDVTIDGAPNNGHITISGANNFRIMSIHAGTVNLNALAFVDGQGPAGGTPAGNGGALRINSGVVAVNVTNSTFSNNAAGDQAVGGAIFNATSTLNVSNSTFVGNHTNTLNANGGAILSYGPVNVVNSTFSGNYTGSIGQGGGILGFQTTVTLKNTILANNTPGGDCFVSSGLTADSDNIDSDGSCGNATTKTIAEIALGALADNGGPTPTMALGTGSAAIDAGNNALDPGGNPLHYDQRGVGFPRILGAAVDVGAFEALTCSTFPVSVANEGELNAAILCFNAATTSSTYTINLTQDIDLTASTVKINNTTSGIDLIINGGGHTVDAQGLPEVFAFYVEAGTTVTIREITVTGGNTTGAGGAAVITVNGGTLTLAESTVTGNQGAFGGAINNARGTLTITDSTLNNNRATGGVLPLGGAIFSGGQENNPATVTVTNSTFSGNRSDAAGGAIYNSSDSNLNLDSVTIADNEAQNGGGIVSSTDTTVTMRNTIIANSVGGDCLPAGNAVINATYSLIEDGLSCVTGTNTNNKTGDPKLGPLANNGGPTQTRALLPGSPALDAGDTTLTSDQRGEARPFGLADDIGAYESRANGTIIITKQTTPANQGDFDFSHNITTTTAFTLAGGQSETFLNVAPGTYTVTEAVEPLWRLVDVRCDDDASPRPSSGSTITRTATIEVEPGETVTCTFSNSEDDIIFVQKLTEPAGGTGFNFTVGGDATDSFSLDHLGVEALQVGPGTYTITEADPGPDYTLIDIDCTVFGPNANDESDVSGDGTSRSVTLTLGNGQAAFCLFENEKVGTITVVKEADPSDNTGFDFTLRGDASQDFTLRDPDTKAITFTLPAGSYEIAEVNLPAGWGNYNLVCTGGDSTLGVADDQRGSTAFIDLAPGDAVTCTYQNAKHGNITIVKDADPADDTVFDFFISNGFTIDPFSLQDPTTPEELFPDLAAGVYYIAEAPQAGWTLDDIRCDSTNGTSTFDADKFAGTLAIDLAPDDDVTCTFVNEKHGTITIEKDADPADDTEFAILVAGTGAGGTYRLKDPSDATRTIVDLAPGSYLLSEVPTTGWALTDITCASTLGTSVFSKTFAPAFSLVDVDLAPGDDVNCTFQNKKRGSITIVKDADPADNTPFDFGISGSDITGGFVLNEAFTLRDPLTTTKTFSDVVPSSYAIGEDLLADWNLTAINCDSTLGTSSQDDNLGLGATNLTLASGDDVTCTFVNQAKRGAIIIEKTSVPAGATGFSFSGDVPPFTLNGGEKKSYSNVAPGTYNVTEATPPSPFKLSGLVCSDSNPNGTASTWDVTSATATINLDPGETVRCRFTNTAANSVTVEKITIPSTSDSFGFTGTLGSFNLRDGEIQTYADVAAGQITISENDPAPAGYKLTDITCTDATGQSFSGNLSNRSVTLDLTQGNSLHCAFTNTQLGTVIIRKATAPTGGSGFTFGGDLGSFTLKDKGKEVIANVEPGAYAVSEDDPTATGFELSGISCVDSIKGGKRSTGDVATATATINLDPGETVTCTFTNAEPDTITVEKVTSPDSTDSSSFDGTLGAFPLDGGSVKDFTGLTAGQYTITEDDPTQAGYRLSRIDCVDSVTGVVFPGNVISRTVTMSLTPGERVHCTFTNSRIFGDPAVRITESYLVSRVEEGKISGDGSQACYWLTLASYTGVGDVTVSIGQPANGQVTVNKSTVVLNSSNWNNLSLTDQSNFVCIRPVDDKVADGGAQICRDGNSDMVGNGSEVTDKECGDHTDTIPHSITGATAPGYTTSTPFERLKPDGKQTVTDNTLPVLIQDNDAGGVVLTESYGVSDLDEDGTPVHQACYWVTLTSQPTAAVTVTPQPNGQVSVQPSSLVLNGSNWDALGSDGNKICIRPVQDNAVEGTANQYCADKKVDLYGAGAVDTQVCGSHLGAVAHSFSSSDANYNGNSVPVSGNGPDLGNNGAGIIDVLIRDDDAARLIFTPAAINALEGGVVQYTVRLSSQPTGNVSVTAQASSVSAAGVDATALTFTPADWNVAQTLSVTLPDDNDVNGIRTGGISHGVNSGDGHYNGLSGAAVTLPMTITDDDSASAALSRGSVAVAEGGAGDSYAVRLTMQPTADVVVTVAGGGQVTASPSQLTFTPANWNVAQSVSITAIDDAVDEGDMSSATIGHTASSSDPAYNGAAIATVLAEVTDNDTAALAVGQAAASIAEGASTSYGVALATQPAGPVQVFVVTDGKTSANPAVLTFDASNWNAAQTVTLTGADDDVDNAADVRTSLVTHAAVSGDGAYNGVNDESLRVDVVDNDVAAIRFSESNVRVAKDGQASYSVTLATRPLAPVVVELVPSSGVTVDASCAAASEGVSQCLVFTPENWNVAQSLTLTALTDAPEHIDHLGLSADEGYNGLNARLQVNGVGAPENPVFLPLVVKR